MPARRSWFRRETPDFPLVKVSPGVVGKSVREGVLGTELVCVHGGNSNLGPIIEWEASAAWRIVTPGLDLKRALIGGGLFSIRAELVGRPTHHCLQQA